MTWPNNNNRVCGGVFTQEKMCASGCNHFGTCQNGLYRES